LFHYINYFKRLVIEQQYSLFEQLELRQVWISFHKDLKGRKKMHSS